jgi:hypothetical protein
VDAVSLSNPGAARTALPATNLRYFLIRILIISPDQIFSSKTSTGSRGGEGGARAQSGPQVEPLRRQRRLRQSSFIALSTGISTGLAMTPSFLGRESDRGMSYH